MCSVRCGEVQCQVPCSSVPTEPPRFATPSTGGSQCPDCAPTPPSSPEGSRNVRTSHILWSPRSERPNYFYCSHCLYYSNDVHYLHYVYSLYFHHLYMHCHYVYCLCYSHRRDDSQSSRAAVYGSLRPAHSTPMKVSRSPYASRWMGCRSRGCSVYEE